MDIKEIKHFLKLMDAYGLCEFTFENADGKISLKRPQGGVPVQDYATLKVAPEEVLNSIPEPPSPKAALEPKPASAKPEAKTESDLIPINSPMVGTFYAAASPDSPPLVTEGQTVNEETTVAVIESMKIMSEIKAEVSGVIAKICVGNGQPVEFGQTLFLVRPE